MFLLCQQLEEETALQRQVIHLEKLRAQKVTSKTHLTYTLLSAASLLPLTQSPFTAPAHTQCCCLALPFLLWCCPSVLQEQEELHSYRARVLAELEEEKRKLESHIEEIQEGRVRAALAHAVVS